MPRKNVITPRRETDQSDTPSRLSGRGSLFCRVRLCLVSKSTQPGRRMNSAAELWFLSQALSQAPWQRHRSRWSLTDPSLSIPGLMSCGSYFFCWSRTGYPPAPSAPALPSGWMSSSVASLRESLMVGITIRFQENSLTCLMCACHSEGGRKKGIRREDCTGLRVNHLLHPTTPAGWSCENTH